jgi:wobble nucleotide-excising tRNase
MIENIDIVNFGSFKNFLWRDTIRTNKNTVTNFKKLNIIYGRNYSGKTTLSRVFQCIETGFLPIKYKNPSFRVNTNLGTITKDNIPNDDLCIRVYNRDFVDNHLSFLRDPDGRITPFAIVGSENKEIEKEIIEANQLLGNVEEKTGLRHRSSILDIDYFHKNQNVRNAKNNLEIQLKNKANQRPSGIKHNTLYQDPNYNILSIKEDIKKVREESYEPLSQDQRDEMQSYLKESPLSNIESELTFKPEINKIYKTTLDQIQRKISPTKPITDLLENAVLQAWVKDGIPHHKNKRDTCGFCGNKLPPDLFQKLDEHFNEVSIELENDIQDHIEFINEEKIFTQSLINISANIFYTTLQGEYNRILDIIEVDITKYCDSLDCFVTALESRKSSIFSSLSAPKFDDNSQDILDNINAINELINKNNQKTDTLSHDQEKYRDVLRLNEIHQFISDINLDSKEDNIQNLQEVANNLHEEVQKVNDSIQLLEDTLSNLQDQLIDEKIAADKINVYLNHYFGHRGLRLNALKDSDKSIYRFKIMRGEEEAYNLSEGECSLVAFCYFIAKLDDSNTKDTKPIIYIDDPVSSLDNNHVFFVYSLIESLITCPERDSSGEKLKGPDGKFIYKYEQLFISTHNLEFLKYLKKLSRPGKDHEQFLIIKTEDSSLLELLPSYLKNYITEFNFLFDELYTCSDESNTTIKPHCFYNFGNNLRKFLEAYLFFKYPFSVSSQQDYNTRIRLFFGEDPTIEPLVQRITNEFSHLGDSFDRSIEPIDFAEITKLASFVLGKIKETDIDQFNCLLKSIEKSDPFLP